MKFELNNDGQLAKLYRWTFGKDYNEMPSSLCPYFWKLLIAVVIFPVTWFSYLWGFKIYGDFYNRMRWNYENRSNMVYKRFFTGLFIWAIYIVIALLVTELLLSSSSMGLWDILYGIMIVIGGIITLIILIILIIVGIISLIECRNKIANLEITQEICSIFKERKDSFFENYCPKINWKNKE